MAEVTIDLRDDPSQSVIAVSGEIDITSAPHLHERLMRSLEAPGSDVVVDLRGVSFIDSTGLGVLVNGRQRANAINGRMRLILPEGHARFPFEVTGLSELFERL